VFCFIWLKKIEAQILPDLKQAAASDLAGNEKKGIEI